MSLQTMNRIWKDKNTTGTQRLILLALADRADEDGIAWPGLDWIAAQANIGVRQTRYVLRNLEDSGDLKTIVQRGRNRTNLYIITTGLDEQQIAEIFARRTDILPIDPCHKTGSPAPENRQSSAGKPAVQRRKTGSPAPENRQSSAENRQSSAENRQSTAAEPVDPINHQLKPPVVAAAATAAAAKPPATQPPTRDRKTNPEWDTLCRTYENEIGLLTPLIADHLGELADKYPLSWITEALAESVKANVRKLNYAARILERWHTEGRETVNANRNFAPTTHQNGKSPTAYRDNKPPRRDNGVPVPEEPTAAEWERIDALLAGKPWPPVAQAQAG